MPPFDSAALALPALDDTQASDDTPIVLIDRHGNKDDILRGLKEEVLYKFGNNLSASLAQEIEATIHQYGTHQHLHLLVSQNLVEESFDYMKRDAEMNANAVFAVNRDARYDSVETYNSQTLLKNKDQLITGTAADGIMISLHGSDKADQHLDETALNRALLRLDYMQALLTMLSNTDRSGISEVLSKEMGKGAAAFQMKKQIAEQKKHVEKAMNGELGKQINELRTLMRSAIDKPGSVDRPAINKMVTSINKALDDLSRKAPLLKTSLQAIKQELDTIKQHVQASPAAAAAKSAAGIALTQNGKPAYVDTGAKAPAADNSNQARGQTQAAAQQTKADAKGDAPVAKGATVASPAAKADAAAPVEAKGATAAVTTTAAKAGTTTVAEAKSDTPAAKGATVAAPAAKADAVAIADVKGATAAAPTAATKAGTAPVAETKGDAAVAKGTTVAAPAAKADAAAPVEAKGTTAAAATAAKAGTTNTAEVKSDTPVAKGTTVAAPATKADAATTADAKGATVAAPAAKADAAAPAEAKGATAAAPATAKAGTTNTAEVKSEPAAIKGSTVTAPAAKADTATQIDAKGASITAAPAARADAGTTADVKGSAIAATRTGPATTIEAAKGEPVAVKGSGVVAPASPTETTGTLAATTARQTATPGNGTSGSDPQGGGTTTSSFSARSNNNYNALRGNDAPPPTDNSVGRVTSTPAPIAPVGGTNNGTGTYTQTAHNQPGNNGTDTPVQRGETSAPRGNAPAAPAEVRTQPIQTGPVGTNGALPPAAPPPVQVAPEAAVKPPIVTPTPGDKPVQQPTAIVAPINEPAKPAVPTGALPSTPAAPPPVPPTTTGVTSAQPQVQPPAPPNTPTTANQPSVQTDNLKPAAPSDSKPSVGETPNKIVMETKTVAEPPPQRQDTTTTTAFKETPPPLGKSAEFKEPAKPASLAEPIRKNMDDSASMREAKQIKSDLDSIKDQLRELKTTQGENWKKTEQYKSLMEQRDTILEEVGKKDPSLIAKVAKLEMCDGNCGACANRPLCHASKNAGPSANPK